jgi:hypothetical protein
MNQQLKNIHKVSCRLWRQTLSVDPDGMLMIPKQTVWEELFVMTADLLVLLFVRLMAEVRTLWQRILQTDLICSPAVKASDKSDSPWLIRAVASKYSLWFSVEESLLLGLYGLVTLFFRYKDTSFTPTGVAPILIVFGICMLDLFGWIFMVLILKFNSRQSITYSRMQFGQNSEPQPDFSHINNKNYRR